MTVWTYMGCYWVSGVYGILECNIPQFKPSNRLLLYFRYPQILAYTASAEKSKRLSIRQECMYYRLWAS